ncbi:MAG: M1 family peptidase [Crocinitomicaceae bacterium]|nr:M1 family peptidase [Crocinitomicaceae bacterium]
MKISYLLVALLFVVSCGTKKSNSTASNAPVSEIKSSSESLTEVDETPTVPEVYQASKTMLMDLIHTKLELKPDWEKAYLYGVATITAKPHFYSSDSLILDAKGMTINSVKLNGKELKYNYADDKLKITLDKIYSRNDQYTVVIDYVSRPNERETGGSAAISSDKGLYFINNDGSDKNKMPQIWTQGETESNSVWFPTIEATNQKSSQEVYLTVADKYVTLSNGKLVSSKKNSDGTRTDYWKQELPHAPYLFMIAVGEFKIVKDSYTRNDGKKIDVFYYVEPEWEKYAQGIFGKTPEMIGYFSKLLNYEYPWDKYHQIVVRDYVSGAMENTGAVVFGDFTYATDRELLDANSESIIAHELFHHWFGDLVTCESWSNLPLNESFANYSQYLWDEYKYGVQEADYNAEIEAKGYMQSAQAQGYHDLIWFTYENREEMFDGHSYNKGGRILHMLRNYVGDEAFFKSLNRYLTVNQFKSAEFHQLRIAFEEVTGEDLNWFFNQWFTGSGHPTLSISQRMEGNEVVLSISQKQNLKKFPLFRLPIQVAVVDDNGKNIYKVVVDKLENEFRFPVKGTLKTVIPDYQEALLAVVNETKDASQFIEQYYQSEKWRTRNRALNLGTKKIDEASSKLILDCLNDPFWGIRSIAIDKAARLKEGNREKAAAIIKELAVNDPSSSVRAKAINFISRAGLEGAEAIFTNAFKDSSYSVVAATLNALSELNPELALKHAEQLEKEADAPTILLTIGSLYANTGDSNKFDFFKENLTNGKATGFDELGLMNTFTSYVAVLNTELIEKAIPVYEYLKENGGTYTKMFIPQNINYILSTIKQRIDGTKDQVEVVKLKDIEAKYTKLL